VTGPPILDWSGLRALMAAPKPPLACMGYAIGKDPLKVLRDLVDELVDVSVARRLVPTREQIWITSACKMAVKSGDPLSHAEMEKLIVDLASTENPYLCPHGRPITVTISRDELFRKFKRT
jgi:DNA mismatch repair protein MutL